MRVACIFVPHFAVEIERLEQPSLRGRPVVVGGAPEERKEVQDCSAEAAARGVRPGMSLREALSRCGEAAFLEARPDHYRALTLAIVDALLEISEGVELADSGVFYLEVGETRTSTEPDPLEIELAQTLAAAIRRASGLTARVGIADGKFAAYVAAVMGNEP